MKNKILLIALFICVCIFTLGIMSVSAGTYNGLVYSYTGGNIIITKCGSITKADIPAYINGKPVTEIGDKAFYNCATLKSVTIPNTVTSIGTAAFSGCSSLRSVIIENGVTSIGNLAFSRCTSLTDISIPNSVKLIDVSAFENCSSLKSIIIPNGITSIQDMTFEGCSNLTSITIPSSVKLIESAFVGCSKLTNVYISDIAAWCNIKFKSETFNPLYYAHNLYLNGELIKNLIIPDTVTSIGQYTFYGCNRITSLSIGNNVTSIGKYAFSDCNSLTSITIPNSVTLIDSCAFFNCNKLTGVYISDIAAWCNIKFSYASNPLYYAHNFYLNGNLVTDLTIPEGVTSIGSYAFISCNSFTSVTIPDGVTSLNEYVFEDCSNLASVTIPSSITSIGFYAFNGCNNLNTVYYNGTEDNWDRINIEKYSSDFLKTVNKVYFYYITLINECGTSLGKVKCDTNSFVDVSKINNLIGFQPLNLYTDKNCTQIFNLSTPITQNITLYALTTPSIKATSVTTSDNMCMVIATPSNVSTGAKIILVCYKNGKVVTIKSTSNKNETIYFLVDKEFDSAKIIAWDSFENMIPLCQYEPVSIAK